MSTLVATVGVALRGRWTGMTWSLGTAAAFLGAGAFDPGVPGLVAVAATSAGLVPLAYLLQRAHEERGGLWHYPPDGAATLSGAREVPARAVVVILLAVSGAIAGIAAGSGFEPWEKAGLVGVVVVLWTLAAAFATGTSRWWVIVPTACAVALAVPLRFADLDRRAALVWGAGVLLVALCCVVLPGSTTATLAGVAIAVSAVVIGLIQADLVVAAAVLGACLVSGLISWYWLSGAWFAFLASVACAAGAMSVRSPAELRWLGVAVLLGTLLLGIAHQVGKPTLRGAVVIGGIVAIVALGALGHAKVQAEARTASATALAQLRSELRVAVRAGPDPREVRGTIGQPHQAPECRQESGRAARGRPGCAGRGASGGAGGGERCRQALRSTAGGDDAGPRESGSSPRAGGRACTPRRRGIRRWAGAPGGRARRGEDERAGESQSGRRRPCGSRAGRRRPGGSS